MKRINALLASFVLIGALLPVQALPHKHTRRPSPPARAAAAKSVTVWVNTASGVYHYPGERWYGKTKQGKYISETEAIAEGDRPTRNGQ